MTSRGSIIGLPRNIPVRDLIAAPERDGFRLRRNTRSGARIYSHPDGRMAVVHYHRGGDTLPRGTLGDILRNYLKTMHRPQTVIPAFAGIQRIQPLTRPLYRK